MTHLPSSDCSSSMAPALFLVVMLAMFGISDGAWCVCKQSSSTSDQQKAIDYACGNGANCAPIQQNGVCYNPPTVLNHCSYAANSYYQIKNQDQQACNFAGTAQLVPTDPSSAGCTYPATPSAAGSGGTTNSSTQTPPGSSTPTPPGSLTTPPPPSGYSPNTPGTGTGTGTSFSGLGPTGAGIDGSGAAVLHSFSANSIILSAIVLLRVEFD